MKKFNIFRYLKQFSLLIFLLAVVGSVAIFLYGKSQQRYIATVVIQYTNTGAKEGLTPDGSPLDVTEIYSSTVIDRALRELDSSANIDSVRSNCYVEEVIPEDQQKLNEALIEKGQESTYIPDTYKVFFVADSDKDEDYAWNILDSIIKNYCEFYTEKYVEEQLQSNDSLAMLQGEYDFIESAQILENDVSQMLDYLLTQRANWPNFRSVETGYTYGDLYNIYSYLYSYDIPNLYSLILGTAETKDIEVLKNRLTRDSEDLQLSIDQCQQQANHLKLLIDNYSGRNKEMMDYHYHNSNSQDGGTEYILKDVEYDKDNNDKETTYDGLIQEYVNLNINTRQKQIEKAHNEYLLSVFNNALETENRKVLTTEELQEKIDQCNALIRKYDKDVEETGRELNRFLSADYLNMVSSINVSTSVNLKLYLVIAVVLFTVVGGIGAVLLGRLMDFIDYLLYVDKTVGLPNRAKCDEYITEHSSTLVKENFSCLVMRMVSLNELTRDYGRVTGDAVLKDFGMILKSFGERYGFVGYNDGGIFLSFFPDCSAGKLDVMIEAINRQVAEYNKVNAGREIRFIYGKAVSDVDSVFEIRGLLRLAMQRMNTAK